MPTPENIRNHTYGFSTDEHLYVRKDATPEAKSFVNAVADNKQLLLSYGIY
jgi:hypothetical protein